MKIQTCTLTWGTFLSWLLLPLSMILVSCSWWHDDQEGCEATRRVRFVYDMNMLYADAFAHEVKTVTLHAFDSEGKLVYTKTAPTSEILANDGMNVDDMPSGVYDLQVWAEGEERHENSYIYKGIEGKDGLGKTNMGDFLVLVNRDDNHFVNHDLTSLFHGIKRKVDLTAVLGENKTVTVKLTKDTNHFKIILQQLSGKSLKAKDFDFAITDNNGYLDYDNSLLADDELTYPAWSKYEGEAGVNENTGVQTSVSAALAELTTNRLVKGHQMRLHVYEHSTGRSIINIPLIDYALLVKGNYHSKMDDQEYLDRQDSYNLVFFLDEKANWLATTIYINSWRVVLNNSDFGNSK